MLDFNEKIGFDFDLLAVPKRKRGRPPGSKTGAAGRRAISRARKRDIALRPRLEALISKALDFQLDNGVPFVQAVAMAMQARPLEALKVFAAYLPTEIHAEVHSVAELHLRAVRELSMVDITPNHKSAQSMVEENV